MWALRCPVERHWLTNWPWERFITVQATNIEIGTETSAMQASNGLIQNIIARIVMTLTIEVSSCDMVCCSDWLMLSMSLVTRERISPRGWESKYSSGSTLSFSSTSARRSLTVELTSP